MRAVLKPFVLALALVAVLLAAQTQPAAGRGSSGIVGITDLGSGDRESWVFIANEPPECLVVFLHAAGRTVPAHYIGWLDYLAGAMSCAVIFPRYQLSASGAHLAGRPPCRRVGRGRAHPKRAVRLRADPSPTTLRTVVVGVGLGGSLAFYYAANAKRWGLPVPVALDSIFPTPGHVAGTAASADLSRDGGARPAERRPPGGGKSGSRRPAPVPRAASRVPQAHADGPFEPRAQGDREVDPPHDRRGRADVLDAARRLDRRLRLGGLAVVTAYERPIVTSELHSGRRGRILVCCKGGTC